RRRSPRVPSRRGPPASRNAWPSRRSTASFGPAAGGVSPGLFVPISCPRWIAVDPARSMGEGPIHDGRGAIRALWRVPTRDEHRATAVHLGVDADETLRAGEAGEVAFVRFHVRAEARPQRARFFFRERLAVDNCGELGRHDTSPAICWACVV